MGGAIGVAAIAAIATARTENVIAAGERLPAIAFTAGYQTGYLVAAAIALFGAIVVVALLAAAQAQPVGARIEGEPQAALVAI